MLEKVASVMYALLRFADGRKSEAVNKVPSECTPIKGKGKTCGSPGGAGGSGGLALGGGSGLANGGTGGGDGGVSQVWPDQPSMQWHLNATPNDGPLSDEFHTSVGSSSSNGKGMLKPSAKDSDAGVSSSCVCELFDRTGVAMHVPLPPAHSRECRPHRNGAGAGGELGGGSGGLGLGGSGLGGSRLGASGSGGLGGGPGGLGGGGE